MTTAPTEPDPGSLTRRLRARAREHGFDEIGIARAVPPDRDVRRLDAWLAAGHHASMAWMERHAEARRDPTRLLPGCRFVVVVTLDYHRPDRSDQPPERARVARYARGRDYHRAFGKRIRRLASWLERESGHAARTFVDTGPVLERAYAEAAGLGWIGKNACLISPHRGSWFLLGVVLSAAELVPDRGPHPEQCGSCTACLDACPTQAILGPGVIDSNRCVSYWTIEHRGPVREDMRPGIGDWLFGCDDCQSVCPWNQTFAREASPANAYESRPWLARLDPVDILRLDESSFRERFEGTALMRARRDGLRRNACIVLGNRRDPGFSDDLVSVLDDDDPVARGHAAWALGRIGDERADAALRDALVDEPDPTVRREIEHALASISKS